MIILFIQVIFGDANNRFWYLRRFLFFFQLQRFVFGNGIHLSIPQTSRRKKKKEIKKQKLRKEQQVFFFFKKKRNKRKRVK